MDMIENLAWPLMKNNLAKEDFEKVVELLHQEDPILTNQVRSKSLKENGRLGLASNTASL